MRLLNFSLSSIINPITTTQKDFDKTIQRFSKIEYAREQLWNRARILLENGYDIEAYVLILATWNFAYFRYFMKKFDIAEFTRILKEVEPVFEKLKNETFETIDLKNLDTRLNIKLIYTALKVIAGQTGATKLMALKNSRLFIMWDTEIRKMYKINNAADSDDYIDFFMKMKEEFYSIKVNDEQHLAKVIDEYNYVLAEDRRFNRKR